MDKFKSYWLGMPVSERKLFAVRCGTTDNYLNMVAHGQKPRVGEKIAIAIERESSGAVCCEDLRPDVDWAYIRSTGCPGGRRKTLRRKQSDRRQVSPK